MILSVSDQLAVAGPLVHDQVFSLGIWAFVVLFFVFLFSSTVPGGMIPGNLLLLLAVAAVFDYGLSVTALILTATGGGFAGYQINYWSGRFFDLSLSRKGLPGVLNETNLQKARDLTEKYGPVALILSRFLPVFNLPPFIAGVESMNSRSYVFYNLLSAVLWCGIVLVLGYLIANIPLVRDHIDFITFLFLVIAASAFIVVGIMMVRDYLRSRNDRDPV